MIICPVCNTTNHHLEIICRQCGGYIQTKIENIDLFQKLWQLIENPVKAFKHIAIAKHKNYIIFLTSLFGMSFLFLLFEYINIGRIINRGVLIALAGMGGGIVFGFFFLVILTWITLGFSKLFKSPPTKFWNLFSVIAYSTVPIIYIFIFLLPIKLLTFGIILYTSNPSPVLVNASVSYISWFLEALMFAWFIFLFNTASRVVFEFNFFKAITMTLALLLSLVVGIVIVINYISSSIISSH
ncbi:MAG: hypothetical protein Q8K98_04965 [Bacteroidota bacterium]|nr:hypothetical protein [Bacteroidota bacterium]